MNILLFIIIAVLAWVTIIFFVALLLPPFFYCCLFLTRKIFRFQKLSEWYYKYAAFWSEKENKL